MYCSKFDDDLEDECHCDEIIGSRHPESYYSRSQSDRKKEIKKEKDTCYQKSIDKFEPCVCPEGDFQYVKSIKKEKPSSISKDTRDVDTDNLKKKRCKNRISMKKKSKPYRTKEVYDQDCSIIYCNKFEDEEQLPEYVCPSEAPKTQEDHDWTGSDISVCTFPITEKQIGKECLESKRANERKCDQRDDAKSKDPFADIPSIQSYDLPDPVERKPEPEVLATVLLSSEKDDLREVKPSVIFDKLFLDATSHQNFTIDTKKESARTNNIDDLPLDTIQIVSFAEEPMDYGDMEDYNQKKWTKDEMLKYMMKPEATTAYKNYVRLNGSVKPSWFPGYVLVSPLIPDCIRITSDPGEGLLEAWRLCRPRHFDEFSKSFLNTA